MVPLQVFFFFFLLSAFAVLGQKMPKGRKKTKREKGEKRQKDGMLRFRLAAVSFSLYY